MTFANTAPRWHKNFIRLLQRYEAQTGRAGASEPEFRLPPAVGGAPLVTVGLFMFAWTKYQALSDSRIVINRLSYPFVHWIVPIIGSGIFGAG